MSRVGQVLAVALCAVVFCASSALAFAPSIAGSRLILRNERSCTFRGNDRRAEGFALSMQASGGNFFSKFARTIVEKAKADVERTKRLFQGLESIRSDMSVIDELLSFWNLDEADDTLEKLEDALISRDFGVATAARICSLLRDDVKSGIIKDPRDLRKAMKARIVEILERVGSTDLILDDNKPAVLMMVGVNGGGKTTTVGKLASKFRDEGRTVMLAAGDTFRAAADLQLEEWCNRAGATMAPRSNAKSPAAVMFDAIDGALAQGTDVLIADTSGRLHTNNNLMEELKKVREIFRKKLLDKPIEVLLVVDSSQGQNVLQQARGFNKAVGVTGIVLTKLDGTGKGGVAVSVVDELKIPVKFIGVGEKIEDLMIFDAKDYVEALFPN